MSPRTGSTERSGWISALASDEHDIACVVVCHGRVERFNRAAQQMFGSSLRNGTEIESLVAPGSRGDARQCARARRPGVWHLQISGVPAPYRLIVLSAGRRRVLLGAIVHDADEADDAAIDIATIHGELGWRVRTLSRRTSELVAERSLIMATLAHEIRSPLWAIRLLMDRLRREDHSPSTRQLADRIERNVAHIARVVQSVQRLFVRNSDEVPLTLQELSLAAIAREALDVLEPSATRADIRLELTTDGGQDRIMGDRTWLAEAIQNLVANAIRHSPRSSSVRIAVTTCDATVRCTVSDEGPGVPRELWGKIFDRNFQYGQYAGSAGLGLFIARRVIAAHGGRIGIQEAAGPGACFVFELPAY
jgi:two-component system sensor histidine kinase BaeS